MPSSAKTPAMPPTMPLTWKISDRYIASHSQRIHDTRQRGPGNALSASSVVRPVATAVRASWICTNTFSTQPSTMNHNRLKPTDAPSLGVTMSSPDPTIVAVMMKPGPRWRTSPPSDVGGGLVIAD